MPELPEVETFVRELQPLLQDRAIVNSQIFWPRTIAAPEPDFFSQRIVGQRFETFGRRGKYILIGLSGGDTFIIHLRMTGKLFVQPATGLPDKHTHVVLGLDHGQALHFQDTRKFGRMWLVADPLPVLEKLGPEPLAADFQASHLAAGLQGRAAPIKALLLDQRLLAGVGNIYADEALFRAKIHPLRAGRSLTFEEIEQLYEAIRQVLLAAIAACGSSLGASSLQNYLRPNGTTGNFQNDHAVYNREGQPCRVCGTPIQRLVIAQRSSHFCPHCQPGVIAAGHS
jgi:formamidopyrimidine-DNA glycosylase